jgi:hypothetical protein
MTTPAIDPAVLLCDLIEAMQDGWIVTMNVEGVGTADEHVLANAVRVIRVDTEPGGYRKQSTGIYRESTIVDPEHKSVPDYRVLRRVLDETEQVG